MTVPDHRPWFTTWGEIIASVRALVPDDEVWFNGRPHGPDHPCAVVDGTEIIDDVPPDAVLQRGWRTVLGAEELQAILRTLTQQVSEPDMDLILRAVRYYLDRDAFLFLD